MTDNIFQAIELIDWSDPKLLIIFFLVFLLIGILIYSRFQRKRIYYASRFGKSEHFFGRLLGIMLIVQIFSIYLKVEPYNLIGIIACFIVWFLYLASHTIEKALYGHHGPRG